MESGNIEKRIKRHVLGKTMPFLASAPPGLEAVCAKELSALGLFSPEATLLKGGVEFKGRVHDCYLANFKLRTASRIVMRIASFDSTNFRQLGKNLAEVNWELYLHRDAPCEIHVAARHSRLFHKGAIMDHVKTAITDRWRHIAPEMKKENDILRVPQRIFVRAADDRFTLSIDSSGDLLHKRGLKTHGGKAPIRETIAAGILALANYRGHGYLLDPMCGAGTFSLEGAMAANNIPSGWYRDFAFMGWPCFKPSRWKHIRREAEKSMTRINEPIIFASDKDPATCSRLQNIIQKNDLSGTVSVFQKDFFDLLPLHITERRGISRTGLIVLNPPYGRRLETKKESRSIFTETCKKLKKDFNGWGFALIASDSNLARNVPFDAAAYHFMHGGLDLILLTGRIT